MKKYILAIALVIALGVQAQEVSTLYFLENAPMRHLVNPAFQPISKGYVNFSPLGYSSIWLGNNSLTLNNIIYSAPNGSTVTAIHPEYGDRVKFLNTLRNPIVLHETMTLDLVSFGFRIKEKGYFTFQVLEKMDGKEYIPKSLFEFVLNGNSVSPTDKMKFDLSALGIAAQVYTEIGGGYSHQINDIWTVGGKLKILLGTAYVGLSNQQLALTGSTDVLHLNGQSNFLLAGPLDFAQLPEVTTFESLSQIDFDKLLPASGSTSALLTPSGYGAAIDLGFTATPLKQLQISVALNDLGFIYWNNARNFAANTNISFTGVGPLEFGDYVIDGQFNKDGLFNDVINQLKTTDAGITLEEPTHHFCRMITTKLNVGVDGRFFDNRLGVGLLSKTMLYNGHLSEEVTLGVVGKPCRWFNIAASYSLVNNGQYSNIGAGLSFMPYDGVNLTLAADYIPTYYAPYDGSDVIPSRTKGVNVALGFSIVWGTNPKKEKKAATTTELEMVEQPTAPTEQPAAPAAEQVKNANEN